MSANSDFIQSLNAATAAMAAKINVKADTAFTADNALKLGNKTAVELVNDSSNLVLTHKQNLSNPHNTTAAQAQAYNKTEIETLLARRLPAGLLPLSRWASNTNGDGDIAPPFVFSNNPLSVAFDAMTALLNGTQYKVPAAGLNLIPNAVNYLYFKLTGGIPQYTVSAAILAETNIQMFIGTVTTTTVVTSNTIAPVVRLGLYRLSTTRRGSSIPVSGGSPASAQPLLWT